MDQAALALPARAAHVVAVDGGRSGGSGLGARDPYSGLHPQRQPVVSGRADCLIDIHAGMAVCLDPLRGGDVSVPWILRGRPNLVPLAREVIRP
jgi:hypothetical protein